MLTDRERTGHTGVGATRMSLLLDNDGPMNAMVKPVSLGGQSGKVFGNLTSRLRKILTYYKMRA